jgi:hypothetical protein
MGTIFAKGTHPHDLPRARKHLDHMMEVIDRAKAFGHRDVIFLMEEWTRAGTHLMGSGYHIGARRAWGSATFLEPVPEKRSKVLREAIFQLERASVHDEEGLERRFARAQSLMLQFVYEFRKRLAESDPKESVVFTGALARFATRSEVVLY